jgi:hypothetical protein
MVIRCRPVVSGCLLPPVVSKIILVTDIARFGGYEPTVAFDVIDILILSSHFTADQDSLEWRKRIQLSERTEAHWVEVHKVVQDIQQHIHVRDDNPRP